MSFRRDHHHVSRGYLKRWSADGTSVWVYRTLVSHESVNMWERKSTREVGFKSHLYTRSLSDGDSDEIEKWFDREFETPAEAALQKAVTGQRMEREDWRHVVRFTAAHDVRSPARLEADMVQWRESVPATLQETMEEAIAKLKEAQDRGAPPPPMSPRALDELFPLRVVIEDSGDGETASIKAEVAAGRAFWLWNIERLLSHTIDKIPLRGWTILLAPSGVQWITSDNPVIRLNYYQKGSYDFLGGWDNPGSEILFPLSPRHLLYRQAGRVRPNRGKIVSLSEATLIQGLIAEHAHRAIFAVEPDSRIETLRAREVNAKRFQQEKDKWLRWHGEQSELEREFLKQKRRD